MDLLLDLAERQPVDLGRIVVLDLVEQLVAASDKLADRVPGERHVEWLVLAIRLVLLREANRPAVGPVHRPVRVQLWRVEQALAWIRQMLAEDPEGAGWRTSCRRWGWRRTGCGRQENTLVACLELARQGEVEAGVRAGPDQAERRRSSPIRD